VRFGGIEAAISYVGGTGNDITLTVTDQLKIVRTIAPDAAVVAVDGGGGGVVFTQRSEAAPIIIFETARTVLASQGTDIRPQSIDTRSVERLRVFLKVVDEVTSQEEGKAVELDPRVIDNVLGFFQQYRFPNGRYRIYLQEAGKSARMILEIDIRDGKVVSPQSDIQDGLPALQPEQQPAAIEPTQSKMPADGSNELPTNVTPGVTPTAIEGAGDSDKLADLHTPPDEVASGAFGPKSSHRWSYAIPELAAGLAAIAAAPRNQLIRQILSNPALIPRTRFHSRFSSPPLPPT
jgi:hypothetical protein